MGVSSVPVLDTTAAKRHAGFQEKSSFAECADASEPLVLRAGLYAEELPV